MQRINLGKAAPELYKTVYELDNKTTQILEKAGIEKGFGHLLRLRASQLNECAFCARMHARDALSCGESSDRLAVLVAWRETTYFTDKEAAALELVEAITLIAEGQIPDDVYQRASSTLSEDELVAISWLGVTINAWNRIGIAGRLPVAP